MRLVTWTDADAEEATRRTMGGTPMGRSSGRGSVEQRSIAARRVRR